MHEAEISYSVRTGCITVDQLEQVHWDDEIKFKANDSDSRSFEISDLIKDQDKLALGWLFNQPLTEEKMEELG